MTSAKYIGLDVHQATIAAAVLDANGKLVMESILETRASTILDFIRGVRGELNITFEEGVSAEWLYGVLKADVATIVVCDLRKNALLKFAAEKSYGSAVQQASAGFRRYVAAVQIPHEYCRLAARRQPSVQPSWERKCPSAVPPNGRNILLTHARKRSFAASVRTFNLISIRAFEPALTFMNSLP